MSKVSIENQIYLCKYHDIDENICCSTGLKKNEIDEVITKLKKNGMYEIYRKMSDEEYEKIIEDEKKKERYKNVNSQEKKATSIKKEPLKVGEIEDTYVKVSVKTIMDWSYQKGYLDRMLEEGNNESNR